MKEKVIIDKNECIGCGLCIDDCPSKVIDLKNNKAEITSNDCLKCGHCIAICPKNAVEISNYDMNEVKEYSDMSYDIKPDDMMDFYKSLRTIRQFKNKEVEDRILNEIIEAGRYSATGTNRQGVRYIVVKKDIYDLEEVTLSKLRFIKKIFKVVGKFVKFKYDLNKYDFKKGFLFRDAKALILVISKNELDAGLAAKNMEIMSRTYGLGGLHVGIFTAIANRSKTIKKKLGLKKKEKLVACLALGYPDVKYQRTVPRRKAKVEWR